MMINAIDLRNKENIKKIQKKPGYYKWWATKEDYNLILNKLNINYEDIKDNIEIKDNLYCVYVGIAVNETVANRLNWHINQKHTKSAICSGYLSTLRFSISSIVSNNLINQEKTDEFINKLKIEYFLSENEIKSQKAKNEIETIEKELMINNLYVFNIQNNHHKLAKPIKKQLKNLRKSQRENAVNYFENR